MEMNITVDALFDYVSHQLDSFFPDGKKDIAKTSGALHALNRLEHCFHKVQLKYFNENGVVRFDYLHLVMSCTRKEMREGLRKFLD
jgi:serine O-acetyltransferase